MIRLEHLPADVLGLAPLARHALARRPLPLPGLCVPRRLEDVPRPPDALDADERAALAHDLERGLSALEPPVAVLDSVRALARPGASLVLAGQQPGFLGGPLFNLWKALHAVRLARELAPRLGAPVVPAFWNHADDHDVAEAHHIHVVNAHLDVARVHLSGLSSGRTPLSQLRVDAAGHALGALAALLRQTLPGGERLEHALGLFLPRDGETLARAFTRGYTELLGHTGLLVLEPDWIRPALSRALADVVGRAAGPLEPLRAGALALSTAGFETALEPEHAALVYHIADGERRALRPGGEGFRYDDEPGSRTAVELAAEIVQSPLEWSAGALLRPLVQDLALPVAAYVGGFGELAYHAVLGPLRAALGAPRTPFVPRLSCTLVDAPCRAALARVGLTLEAALRAGGRLALCAPSSETPAVVARLRAAAGAARAALLAEREALCEIDRGLSIQLKRAADQARALIDKLAAKAERVDANRSGKSRRHLRRLDSTLVPRESPQERVLSTLELIARHGRGWIDELLGELNPLPCEHLVVHLDAEEDAAT